MFIKRNTYPGCEFLTNSYLPLCGLCVRERRQKRENRKKEKGDEGEGKGRKEREMREFREKGKTKEEKREWGEKGKIERVFRLQVCGRLVRFSNQPTRDNNSLLVGLNSTIDCASGP